MKTALLILILFSLFTYCQQQTDISWPTLADSPWPMIKHDPQFTGRSPYKGPQTPTIIWTADLENGIFSGPVIGPDSNLYFGTYFADPQQLGVSDYFYCYSPKGELIWEYKTGTKKPPLSGILIDSSRKIYFGGSMDKNIYSLFPDGRLNWKYETTSNIGSSLINIDLQGNIYVTNYDSLYSFSSDGKMNWHIKFENGFRSKSPVISPDGGAVYIAGKDSNMYALTMNGALKWKFSCGKIIKAPAVDSDGNIYITPEGYPQYYYSLYPTGAIRWKYLIQQVGLGGSNSVPAIDYEGNSYIIAHDSTYIGYYPICLISLDYYGAFRWKYIFDDVSPDDPEDFYQPLICDSEGTVYVGSTFGWYYYAISSNGVLKWRIPLEFDKKQVDNTGAISSDGTLFIGVHGGSLVTGYTQTLIAIKDTGAISIKDDQLELKEYKLSQNYPNPFNPTTTIKYSLPQTGRVTLSIYDLLGREAVKLIDEEKPAGEYETKWNAQSYPSGVYFLKMQAGQFSETRKLLLMK